LKKVLIISYHFPPDTSVASLRSQGWYNDFQKLGIHPVILTRQWSNDKTAEIEYVSKSKNEETIIKEYENSTLILSPYFPNFSNRLLLKYGIKRYKLIRKIFTAFFEIFQYFLSIGSKKEIYTSAKSYLSKNKVDLIIATGDPFVLFHYANKLSKKYSIPWIADYRDLWSQDFSMSTKVIYKTFLATIEKRIVKTASCNTTVSPLLKEKLKKIHPSVKCAIIRNGFNKQAIEKVNTLPQNTDLILKIGFVGSLSPWNPVKLFIQRMNAISSEYKIIELNFYGINTQYEIEQFINTLTLSPFIKINFYPRMKNDLVLEKLAKSNVLLLFNHYSLVGTKIYDYIALNRRILFCYTDDFESDKLRKRFYHFDYKSDFCPQADILKATQSGDIVKDDKQLIQVIDSYFEELKSKKSISCNSSETAQYSRFEQNKKLVQLINTIFKNEN